MEQALGDGLVELAARPADAFNAAQATIRDAGYECVFLGERVEGEAREVAAEQAQLAKRLQSEGRRAVILSGGELTVTIKGRGRGGPNTEYLLGLALALDGARGINAFAADTDGVDGSEDNAGAIVTPDTLSRARDFALDAQGCLTGNDAYSFFRALGDLVVTGPTFTNVNDFRAILIS